jgi:hypothetical protein
MGDASRPEDRLKRILKIPLEASSSSTYTVVVRCRDMADAVAAVAVLKNVLPDIEVVIENAGDNQDVN